MTLKDYAISLRIGRSHYMGKDSSGRKQYQYIEEYRTDKGDFLPKKWNVW